MVRDGTDRRCNSSSEGEYYSCDFESKDAMLSMQRRYFCIANFVWLLIHVVYSTTLYKSVTLTPSNTNTSGCCMLSHISEVNVVNNNRQWRVHTHYQSAWHFIILLDGSWGFHADLRSTITFIVDSPTIARPHTFDDLIFGFTTDNKEYLSMLIPMHTDGDLNQIYPGCDTKALPTQTFAVGDIASIAHYDRNCDVAGGSCSNWRDMIPPNHQNYNKFPILITLENNPKSNTFSVTFVSANRHEQKCAFVSVGSNKGMKIYLAGNEYKEQFLINSFGITYEAFPPTVSLTNSPTFVPTVTLSSTPLNLPIISHTLNPTNIPSTFVPTVTPSSAPSNIPIISPTLDPTNIPSTFAPTVTPSSAPSNLPTISPTLNPTNIPSSAPLDPPTPLPTHYPTDWALSCGDSFTDLMDTRTAHRYPLRIPYDVETLTISTCEGRTRFNTSLRLLDANNHEIAFDSDGCNDAVGRSKMVIGNVSSKVYSVLVSAWDEVEGLYTVSVSCSISPQMLQFYKMFVPPVNV